MEDNIIKSRLTSSLSADSASESFLTQCSKKPLLIDKSQHLRGCCISIPELEDFQISNALNFLE